MNEQYVVGSGLRKYRIVPEAYLGGTLGRLLTVMLIVTFMGLTVIPPGSALAEEQTSGMES